MPPLQPGDPGDGHGEDDHDEDDVGFRPPLPREDRLWRHPSEVALDRGAPTPPISPTTGGPPPGWRRRTAAVGVAAAVGGATLAVGVVALLGGFDERVVERQVALRPVTSIGAEDPEADRVLAEAVADRTGPAVAALSVHRGTETAGASAIILRSDGYLLTDAHAIAGADSVDVALHDGWSGTATVVGADVATGIAVLHIDDVDDLTPAALDPSGAMAVGARTVVVGARPAGGSEDGARFGTTAVVSTGIISATERRLEAADGRVMHGMILVDRPAATGTAGGALVDQAGAVIGIVSGMPAAGADDVRFGVATPIELANHVAEQLMDHGRARHVWLGVHGTDLDPTEAAAMGERGGARVAEVSEGGPASDAGVRVGDIVLAVDGEPTTSMSELIAALRLRLPGDTVVLTVERDGDDLELTVTLAAKDLDE